MPQQTGQYSLAEAKPMGAYSLADAQATSDAKPVDASEPGTYLGGVMKAWTSGKIQEAELQGLKGFAEGVLTSPVSLVKGIGTLLKQSPIETLQQQVDAIKRIPDAVQAAATDPEGWGQAVGTQAGTTALTAAAGAGIGAGARGVARVASSPLGAAAADVSPDIVGVASPRLANAMRVAQRVQQARQALQDSLEASKAKPAAAPAAAPSTPTYTGTGFTQGPMIQSPSGMASMQAPAPPAAAPAPTPTPPPPVPAPAAASAPASVPPRPYFLKPDAPWPPTPSTMPTPKGPVNLPQAFQPFTKPASFPPTELEGSGLAAAYLQDLTAQGIKASDAIPQVLRNKALTAEMRTQIVTALEKVARAQAAGAASAGPMTFEAMSNRIGQIYARVQQSGVPDDEWASLTSELSKLQADRARLYPNEMAARDAATQASQKAAYSKALGGGS